VSEAKNGRDEMSRLGGLMQLQVQVRRAGGWACGWVGGLRIEKRFSSATRVVLIVLVFLLC
jgi:hypothetical protein